MTKNKKIILIIVIAIVISVSWKLLSDYLKYRQSEEYLWDKSEGETFYRCFCCCPQDEDNIAIKKCLYHSKGDNLEKIKNGAKNEDCSLFGCSFGPGNIYKYCD